MHDRILTALLALLLAACTVEEVDRPPPPKNEEGRAGSRSISDVKAALSLIPGSMVLGSHANGLPFMVRGEFGSMGQSLRGLSAHDVRTHLGEVLGRIAPIFRLNAADLVLLRSSVDERGHTHVRYAQMKNGLPVVGHELLVHVNESGLVYAANGSARDGEQVSLEPSISGESAALLALSATEGTGLAAESARLVYYRSEADAPLELAYEVVVTGTGPELPIRDHVFVSAQDGFLLGRFGDIHPVLHRSVYLAGKDGNIPGTLKRDEGGAATNDAHVDLNYDRLGRTYDCYKTNFNRDSYDNAGARLVSTVHFSKEGRPFINAYWDGDLQQMVYGDGDGVVSEILGKSLDVTVHELTHAVTSNESNLFYSNESGALNEGISDIFAAYCESWMRGWSVTAPIWMIVDDVWTPATQGDAMRYMGDPAQDGSSRDFYPDRYTGSEDYGGVHWNSGIINLMFKLLATGGTHPRNKSAISVPGIGVRKAGAIFYKANTAYFTPSTTFAEAKVYTQQAAMELGYDVAAVTAAWEAVGVGGPPPAAILLNNGEALTGISVDTGAWSSAYALSVPEGAAALSFELSGETGDADLYVRFGEVPTESGYDCRPFKSGNVESCSIPTAKAGLYYVKIRGFETTSDLSLKGSFTEPAGGALTREVETAPYSGSTNSWVCFSLNVPSDRTSLVFSQTGRSDTTGDADLYVQHGSKPTTNSYTCSPYKIGGTESCTISNPSAGIWYACSYGYSSYTDVTMKGSY